MPVINSANQGKQKPSCPCCGSFDIKRAPAHYQSQTQAFPSKICKSCGAVWIPPLSKGCGVAIFSFFALLAVIATITFVAFLIFVLVSDDVEFAFGPVAGIVGVLAIIGFHAGLYKSSSKLLRAEGREAKIIVQPEEAKQTPED